MNFLLPVFELVWIFFPVDDFVGFLNLCILRFNGENTVLVRVRQAKSSFVKALNKSTKVQQFA